MVNIPEKTKEVLTALTPTKEGIERGISSAKDMIVGSGHIGEEITRVGKDYIDMPKTIIGTPLKAMGELIDLNPIGALQNVTTGVKDLSREMIDIVSAPGRGTIALAATVGRATIAPAKGLLAVGQTIGNTIKQPVESAVNAAKTAI